MLKEYVFVRRTWGSEGRHRRRQSGSDVELELRSPNREGKGIQDCAHVGRSEIAPRRMSPRHTLAGRLSSSWRVPERQTLVGGGVITGQAGISADTCIRYALSQPVSSIVVGITSMYELQQNTATARGFTPMPDTDQAALLASVKDVAGDGRYELYKTTQRMDGPYHVKQHGFQVV